MHRRIVAGTLLLSPFAARAQEPVRVSFACTEEQVQSVGLLCSEDEPCPIFLELNAISPVGRRLFVAGDLHATSGTIESVFLSSDDGGVTWKEASPRIPSAALEHVQFYDLEHAWAAGETQYPLPRDPFFLLSKDGGLSWRQQPVTEEGGPGAIQRFWFDSAQHGELVIDAGRKAPGGRFLDYETETGGENWTLRSTTGDLPKLKRAPVAESQDFRIRPTANGKAYQIEKRSGEKWQTVASFLIEVANCRMQQPPPKEPEPSPTPPPTPVPPARE